MVLDIVIISTYFIVIFTLGIVKRDDKKTTAHEYFLKSNTLRWPAIAFSTISTNIHAGHFIGMAGSAYLYGLVQANFEINAILGILIAAFVFIPIYLAANVTTISQFFEQRLGSKVAFTYSILMILLYGFLYLGSTLFWGAYAINAIFAENIRFIHHDPMVRIFFIAIMLGAFSAVYTYLGGMGAVVRTDIAQFVLMVMGGGILVTIVMSELGGWAMLYEKTPNLMHLHMPSDHPKLPWPALLWNDALKSQLLGLQPDYFTAGTSSQKSLPRPGRINCWRILKVLDGLYYYHSWDSTSGNPFKSPAF